MPTKKQAGELKGSDGKAALPPSYSDRTHRIANLAVQIMALVPRAPRDPRLLHFGLDESIWNADFEAARRRAEMLLDDIENQQGEVDAYQLFEEGLLLSCKEISEVFSEAKWKGLTSVDPVRKLMRRIELQMNQYDEELSKLLPSEADEVARNVLYSLDTIASRDGVREVFPDFMERLNEFIASLATMRIRPTKEEACGELVWFEAFSTWCIDKEGTGSTEVIKYRPHELFRFAARKRWEVESLLKASKDVSGPYHPKIHPKRLGDFAQFLDRESLLSRPFVAPRNDRSTVEPSPTESEK